MRSRAAFTGVLSLRPIDVPVELPRPRAGVLLRFPLRLLVVLTLLPLLLAASALAIYRQQLTDRVYPGVRVLDVAVGRMTRDEAAATIKRHVVEQSRRTFVLRYDDGATSVSLAVLGLRVDDGELEHLADRALAVGRVGALRPWLRTQLELVRTGYGVPATFTFDRARAAAGLGRTAQDVDRATVNASLSVEKAGETFEVHTTPAQTGRRVNINASLDRLQKALESNQRDLPAALDLVVDEAPPSIADADLLPAIDTIHSILGSALEFRDGQRSWKLEPAAAFAMLEITGLDTGRLPISVRLNDAKLRDVVEKLARAADQPATNATFELTGDQVTVRPGTPGKLADAAATFEVARERAISPIRTLDVIFVEDKPWVTPADLESARAQANVLLDLPITLEAPPGTLGAERTWVLRRPDLAQMLVLPNTQGAPRDFQTLLPAARPRFDVQLDSGKVTNYLAREVAPWVSEDPTDAELQLRSTEVEVPNPAYTAALAEAQARAQAGRPPGQSGPAPPPPVVPATVPATIKETRQSVEQRNAKDGRGPDYLGTFAAMQVLFRAGATTDQAERRVAVRLTVRPPRVQDRDLAPARDTANRLIGEPVTLRWQEKAWTVTRDELIAMLRYQTTREGLTAYLTRDGLLAKATAIAREAERLPGAPKDSKGKLLPVDVPATASAIWQQASTVARNRVTTVVWTEEEQPEEPAP